MTVLCAALVGYGVMRVAAELVGRANQDRRSVVSLSIWLLWLAALVAVAAYVLAAQAALILIAPAFGLTLLVYRLDGLLLAKSDESIKHIISNQPRR